MHPEAMPRAITHHREEPQKDYYEETATEKATRYLWPISSWFILILNAFIGVSAALKMSDNYSWLQHYSIIIAFTATLAALAAIYKYLIMKEK